ncbi:MAG: patatin-like phospholipase family protein [Candidatus Gastranaerophilales bacterium]|nr:patatin-like phospholipase family protein [Candidatus Gastranaerophilales bacterium]
MNKSLNYNLILGGGAVRGIAYAGAFKAMEELNIKFDTIAGSSVGSVFATLYLLGYTPSELKEICYTINLNLFRDINLNLNGDISLSKGEVFVNWLRELFEKKFYGDKYEKGQNPPITFRDLDKKLYILTSDLQNNRTIVFSNSNSPDFEVAEAVKISCSFPGLMKPTQLNEHFLIDGDLVKSWPLWKTDAELENTDDRILEFRLEGCHECVNIKKPLDYFNAVFSTFTNFCTENVLMTYNHKDKYDYVVIDAKDLLLLDFNLPKEKRDWLIETGYKTTIDYFKKSLPEKKKTLIPYYTNLLSLLNSLEFAISSENIPEAKDFVYELITDLLVSGEFIDEKISEKVKYLKKIFFSNYYKTTFLHSKKLKNIPLCLKIVKELMVEIKEKLLELKEYVEANQQ